MKHRIPVAVALLMVSGAARAEEYRGDVFAQNYSELDINFTDSKYNNQTWIRPGSSQAIKYHDTMVIMSGPGCLRIETGSPSPYTMIADPMLYWSNSSDMTNNSWAYLDDDSLGYNLSLGFVRYQTGTGQKRFRIRTTGWSSSINGQPVDIVLKLQPLSACPTSGANVVTLL